MPRKTRLNQDLFDRIVESVRKGNYVKVACQANGVPEKVGSEWLMRGEGTHGSRPGASIFARFARAIRTAQADAEQEALEAIREAGQGFTIRKVKVTSNPDGSERREAEESTRRDWQALAWWLERTKKDRYRKSEEVTGPDGGPIQIEAVRNHIQALVSDTQSAALAASLADRLDMQAQAQAALPAKTVKVKAKRNGKGNGNGRKRS